MGKTIKKEYNYKKQKTKIKTSSYFDEDGVLVTVYPYKSPRKHEKTYDVNKSKYTPWSQGVSNYTRGTRGVLGTIENM